MTSVRTKIKPPPSISVTYSVAVAGTTVVAEVGWTQPVSAWPNRYFVLYRQEEGFSEVELATSITALTYRDSTVFQGIVYTYAVSTVNINEIEGGSGAGTQIDVPSFPVWATGWNVSIQQGQTISIASRATDPDNGTLTFSRNGGTAPASVTVSSAGVITVPLSAAAGSYNIVLRADNGRLTSDTTTAITVQAVLVAPNVPTSFTAGATSTTVVALSWNPPSGGPTPTKYQLDFSTSAGGPWTNLVDSLLSLYSHTGRTAATQYFYRLRAANGSLFSSYVTANATTLSSSSGVSVPNIDPGGPSWPHGVGNIPLPSGGLTSWQSWMGHNIDIYTSFNGSNTYTSWTTFEQGGSSTFTNTLNYVPNNVTVVHSWPLLPNSTTPSAPWGNQDFLHPEIWDMFAAGDFDSHWHVAMQNMKNRVQAVGRSPSTMMFRLGHEMSGDWYPWTISTSKVEQFKQSWVRAVNIIRTYFPSALISFEPAQRRAGNNRDLNLSQILPPSTHYDVIGRSLHDKPPHTTSASTFNSLHVVATSSDYGLQEIANMARSQGKKMCVSEWASPMVDCSTSHPAPPDGTQHIFFQQVFNFFSANADIMIWDTHFSPGCTMLINSQTTQAAITYKSLWG